MQSVSGGVTMAEDCLLIRLTGKIRLTLFKKRQMENQQLISEQWVNAHINLLQQ